MIAPVDVTDIRIETPRLILRPWQESDLVDFYEYARVDGVGQMCGWLPHKDLEESKMILSMFIGEKKTFALELKENHKVIGSIGLETRDADLGIPEDFMGREIGYVLNKDYWGRGLMPEAVKAVIDYCFKTLDFDWLTCGHFVWNDQSRRVVEKCGFQYVKDVIHTTRFGTEEPTKLYILHNLDKIFLRMNAPFDVNEHRLETPRLILRPLEETDTEDFHSLAVLPEVAEFAGWECATSQEETLADVKRRISYKETFAIVLKETGKFIGSFSVQARNWPAYPIDRHFKGREFGFELHPNYWGRGLMPEAVRAVTDLCLKELGFDFVSAGYFRGNDRSARVIEKCGFTYLFEEDMKLSEEKTVHVFTFVRYKENSPCLN